MIVFLIFLRKVKHISSFDFEVKYGRAVNSRKVNSKRIPKWVQRGC
jgi:hypothetical protein